MRTENEIFADLSSLCRSPGYIHALSYLCFRDNFVMVSGEMTAKDMLPLFSKERLIRTEISTLIGLMVQGELNAEIPTAETAKKYISQTEALLDEMHQAMMGNPFAETSIEEIQRGFNPFTLGKFLREPIFYGGESAYMSQYIDFSILKYDADKDWLTRKKGFSIQDAAKVVRAITKIHDFRVTMSAELIPLNPDSQAWMIAHSFNVQEVAKATGLELSTVDAVVQAFAFTKDSRNETFKTLSDFNAVNATPLLPLGEGFFVHLQGYGLAEALYESPFYWMTDDRSYVNDAAKHRGDFTEAFCCERLKAVFGTERVFQNVRLHNSADSTCKKGTELGEIDALAIFGNRAIIVQTKSKRLTLEARKGNDLQIKDDFKKSVQDSYDQGHACAKLLSEGKAKCIAADGSEIRLPSGIKEIYVLCIVSDNYPALSFQARQFLRYTSDDVIQPPIVLDIFTLDVIAEMLASPLYFLSYVNRRANYHEKVYATNEQVILAYHIKKNLWLDAGCDGLFLEDDFSADLDVAMAVRRDGVRGKATPDGILTRLSASFLGQLIKQIESAPLPATIDLGFLLLTLSEDTCAQINSATDKLVRLAKKEGTGHDVTVGFSSASSGLTIHVNDDPDSEASRRLKAHCVKRKYRQRADSWFGLCISPRFKAVRFGLSLNGSWQQDDELDAITKSMPDTADSIPIAMKKLGQKKKVGRNDLCPCGSGKKYKRCCWNMPRVCLCEATTQEIVNILSHNSRGALLLRDELAGWLGSFDRYSGSGADRGFYLESWVGGRYSVDLVKHTGKPVRVPYASLAILGGLQPDKLREIFLGADDGFAARFCYVWPRPAPYAPLRVHDDAASKKRSQLLLTVGRRLHALQMKPDENGEVSPFLLPLSADAVPLFEEIRHRAIMQARNTKGLAAGWHGKTPARALRFALVIEFLTWATLGDKAEPAEISLASMKHADAFLTYLGGMFERVIGGLAVDEADADAADVARYIVAHKGELKGVLNERHLYQSPGYAYLRNNERRKGAFAALKRAGWLTQPLTVTVGRKRSDWIINPKIESKASQTDVQNAHNVQKHHERRDIEHFEQIERETREA